MHIYTGIEKPALLELMSTAFSGFPSPTPFPMSTLDNVILLDLTQGPTLAFKDVGQQVVAQLLHHYLSLRNAATACKPGGSVEKAHVMIDTSGDTGPAAIAGVKGSPFLDITVLYPHGRTSEVQELQMLTVPPAHPNVHIYRAEGCCDDLSSVLKEVFGDRAFVEQHNVISINSINWARIAAQSTYYVWAYLQVFRSRFSVGQPVNVVIPSGAFGNAMGCFLARRMGVPIGRVVCATNVNDVVHRAISAGDLSMGPNLATLTPAMDIQFAYNLERMVYFMIEDSEDPDLRADPSAALRPIMAAVDEQYSSLSPGVAPVRLSPAIMVSVQSVFASCSVSDEQALDTMREAWTENGIALCPHSAVGVCAGRGLFRALSENAPLLSVLTAHPSKFEHAFKLATGEVPQQLAHNPTDGLKLLPQGCEWLRQHGRDNWRAEWIKILKDNVVACTEK